MKTRAFLIAALAVVLIAALATALIALASAFTPAPRNGVWTCRETDFAEKGDTVFTERACWPAKR